MVTTVSFVLKAARAGLVEEATAIMGPFTYCGRVVYVSCSLVARSSSSWKWVHFGCFEKRSALYFLLRLQAVGLGVET